MLFFVLTLQAVIALSPSSLPRRTFLSAPFVLPLLPPLTTSAKIPPPTSSAVNSYIQELLKSGGLEALAHDMVSPESYTSGEPFKRLDSSPDSTFYADPRFTEHIDDKAVQTLTRYNTLLVKNASTTPDVLDIGCSHVSHISSTALNLSGLGMNAEEMSRNPLLTRPNSRIVQDLNTNPVLPFSSNSFDVVLMQLTVDYLTRPVKVLKAISQTLKPNGVFAVTFSDRVFMSKQVGIWSGRDDFDHILTVVGYVAKSVLIGGTFDISTLNVKVLEGGGKSDPLYSVEVRRSG